MVRRDKMTIKTKGDRIFDAALYILMAVVVIVTVYPIWYIVVASFSSNDAIALGKVTLWIKDFTLESYKTVVSQKNLWVSYGNTIFYSVFGTILNMAMTILTGYALSKRWLPGRRILMLFFLLSMWFGPGMMATYINYRDLGLINNRWGMLIIGAINTYNTILMRSFFESIPEALEESARIDGANDWRIMFQIYLPLSTAALMTISLYYFVAHWNAYFWSMILLQDDSKIPLQVLLKKLVVQMTGNSSETANMDFTVMSRETVVYATMVIAVLPMLIVYPFVQKFFVKGVMIGAVKG